MLPAKVSFKTIAPSVRYRVSSPFGQRIHPVTGENQFHNGIDVPMPIGTALHSPWPGTVLSVEVHGRGGNQVRVRHDNGLITGYAHLHRSEVIVGQRVAAGQRIATSGNTGAGTGPHLHFTIRKADTAQLIDPTTILTASPC